MNEILLFKAYLNNDKLSYASISHYLSGVGFYCKINDIEDVTQKFIVRKVLEGIKRSIGSNSACDNF